MRGYRRLRRRFGIAAPRLTVRTHVAWYWRWIFLVLAIAAGMLVARGIYDVGRAYSGLSASAPPAEAVVRERAALLEKQNAVLQEQVTALKRELQIEKAAHADLVRSFKALQDERAKLKEDVAFFRSFMPASERAGATLTLQKFSVSRTPIPGEFRYQMLLLRSGARDKDFKGYFQFVVSVVEQGKPSVRMVADSPENPRPALRLAFKYYQRVDGLFKIDPRLAVESVQVRVFESGGNQPKLMQTVKP